MRHVLRADGTRTIFSCAVLPHPFFSSKLETFRKRLCAGARFSHSTSFVPKRKRHTEQAEKGGSKYVTAEGVANAKRIPIRKCGAARCCWRGWNDWFISPSSIISGTNHRIAYVNDFPLALWASNKNKNTKYDCLLAHSFLIQNPFSTLFFAVEAFFKNIFH